VKELALAPVYWPFGYLWSPEERSEGKKRLLECLEYYGDEDTSLDKIYIFMSMGGITYEEANYLESENFNRKAIQIGKALNNRRSVASSLMYLAGIASQRGQYQEAIEYNHQVLEIWQSIGYKFPAAVTLSNLGILLIRMGNYEEAKERYLEALAINEDIGKQNGIGFSIWGLGDVAFAMGKYEKAKEHYEKTLVIYKNLENLAGTNIGFILSGLGKVALAMEKEHDAGKLFQEALEIGIGVQSVPLCLNVLLRVSGFLARKEQVECAVEIVSLVANHPQTGSFIREDAKKKLTNLEGHLALENFEVAKDRGQERDVQETAEEMLAWLESIGESVENS